MKTSSARPLGGWVQKGSEVAIPFGAFRRLDNAEFGEDVLRVRQGRTRLNHTAPKKAAMEGRILNLGYGLVKAHSTINPGNANFTVECTVSLPKINRPLVATTSYPLVVRSGNTSQTVIYALELFSTGAALQARAIFTSFDTTAGPPWTSTPRIMAFTLPNRAEGTIYNIALRRGGDAGNLPLRFELLVDGVVQGTINIAAGDVVYGSDAAETTPANMPVGSRVGDRDLIDLFILNSNPDHSYPPATPWDDPLQGDPRLAEVRFWSDSRTNDELLAWSRTELDKFQLLQLELKGYWRLNSGSGRLEPIGVDGILGPAYMMPNPPFWAATNLPDLLPELGFTDWWRFEETSGTSLHNTFTSRDGILNNGVLLNKPGLIFGPPSRCLEFFTGAPGFEPNISVPDNAIWRTQPWTMFAVGLMKGFPTISGFDVAPMMLKEGPGWSFSVGFDSKPFFTIFDSSIGGKTNVTSDAAMPLNRKWSQMATVDAANISLFVDGGPKGTVAYTPPNSAAAGILRFGATGNEQFVGFLDEIAFAAGAALTARNALQLHRAALLGLPKKLEFLGHDHVVRLPYISAYDRIASTDAGKAVKTWTQMWRFRTGNFLQNYLRHYTQSPNEVIRFDERRMTLFQWGNNPVQPQVRASIVFDGTNHKFLFESRFGNRTDDSGTATAGAATTITDGGKAWTVNEWADYEVILTGGTGAGQRRRIISNTGTVLTISTGTTDWDVNPAAATTYQILSFVISTTNILPRTTYTFWVDRSGTALRMFLDDGTVTEDTHTILAGQNGFGTGTTGEIFLGAGVSSEANANAYQHEKFFYGSLEEARLYARVIEEDVRVRTFGVELSKADIEADPDLLLCLQFPEGVGRTTLDCSKSANVGVLTRDFFHGIIGTTPFQWSRERPVVWRAGFMTPQSAPVFNGLGSYVKEGESAETLVGVAGGIAYELAPDLIEQIGTVASEEIVSDTRAFAAVALENRLYLGDGRNPVVAVEQGVVRPCGIADLPASAVPGVAKQPAGKLLGFYSHAIQLKSAFTGALSRPVKTDPLRFKDEAAIVGFGTNVPSGHYVNFNGSSMGYRVNNLRTSISGLSTWTVESQFRAETILTERGESRYINLDGTNDSVRSAENPGQTTAGNVIQPTNQYTYEIRFAWNGGPSLDEYVFIHSTGAAAGNLGTLGMRINSAAATTFEIINGATVIFTGTTAAVGTFRTYSVVRRDTIWELYEDGVLTQTATTAANAFDTSAVVFVGCRQDATNFAMMAAAEFRIFNVARSSSEIADNYRTQITDAASLSKMLVYWRFNEEASGAVKNDSTNTSSKGGTVFEAAGIHPTPAWQFSPVSEQTIFSAEEGSARPGSIGWDLIDVDSALRFSYTANSTTGATEIHRIPNIVANRWYHVAVTRNDPTDTTKIYVNGELVATATLVDAAALVDTDGEIGRGNGFFDGDFDEFRLWSVVRTAEEIRDNIHLEIGSIPNTLQDYYRFDGNTTNDGRATLLTTLTNNAAPTFTTMTGGQIPTGGDDFITARRIYRSSGAIPASESETDIQLAIDKAEAGPFYLIKEIEDNATTQIVDNVPDTELVILLDEDHAGDPPFGGSLSSFGDRLVVAGPPDARSTVFVSSIGEVENFDIVGDALNVADTKAGAITNVLDMTGVSKQALVSTETGGFSLQENGTRLELVKVFAGVGCVSRLGAVRVQDKAIFWSREGPMVWGYGEPQPIGLNIEQAADDEVNHSQFSQVIAVHHVPRRQVYFLLAEVGSNTINANYKFEYGSGKWVRDTGNLRAATTASISLPGVASVPAGTFYSDDLGFVLIADRGNWDGNPLTDAPFDSGRRVYASGSAANLVLTTQDLPLAGQGLKGVEITVRYANGTEQTRTAFENTNNTIILATALSVTPGAGDLVFLGSIPVNWTSGWLDMNPPDEDPSVTRKMFEWLNIHFDQEGLQTTMPIQVLFAVRERGYGSNPAYDTTRDVELQAAGDTFGIPTEFQPIRKIYIPNGLGRFIKFKIAANRPSGWGINQVEIGHEILLGAF